MSPTSNLISQSCRSLLIIVVALMIRTAYGQASFLSLSEVDQQLLLERGLAELREENFHGAIAVKLGDGSPEFYSFGRVADALPAPLQLQVDLLTISKTITAAAIMKLVDLGILSVEQSIADFFATVPNEKHAVTLHHLLTHSAGFRGALGSDNRVIDHDGYIERAMGSQLRFEPGTGYYYSNVGYSLLAAVVEISSGKPFEEFVREDLLPADENLNIGFASIYKPDLSLRTRRGRDIAEASWGHPQPYWHLIGNGGMVADIAGAIRFFDLLTSGSLLSVASTEALFTAYQQELPAESFYGYGVVIDEGQTFKRFHWHNGGNQHFNSWWSYHLDHDVLLFVASTGRYDADRAAEDLLLTLFDNSQQE